VLSGRPAFWPYPRPAVCIKKPAAARESRSGDFKYGALWGYSLLGDGALECRMPMGRRRSSHAQKQLRYWRASRV
jgi:hypothetical protein